MKNCTVDYSLQDCRSSLCSPLSCSMYLPRVKWNYQYYYNFASLKLVNLFFQDQACLCPFPYPQVVSAFRSFQSKSVIPLLNAVGSMSGPKQLACKSLVVIYVICLAKEGTHTFSGVLSLSWRYATSWHLGRIINGVSCVTGLIQ